MTRKKQASQEYISILSMGLVESAFLMLVQFSLPVYKINSNRTRPPVAGPENVNAVLAIIGLTLGLDHHLARLKYLRDIAKHDTPLPYTPYFDWEVDSELPRKLTGILTKRAERRLLAELREITVCRDALTHPKVHTITEVYDEELRFKKIGAKLAAGAEFRPKALANKMKRAPLTKRLRLPVVPTWVSYVDAVICVLVIHRFLNLLENRYGNPYAFIGHITAREKETKSLFTAWDWSKRYPMALEDWARAFFDSLAPNDQDLVRRVLGPNLSVYLDRPFPSAPRTRGLGSLAEDLDSIRNPPKPHFLYKPPPRRP
jgi:hypothetical protein